jgi:HD-GYP domain-containing protein (c-di-GMP phosphodiesterase class II)
MKKVAVETLRAGQVFTQPVYIEGNNLFVPASIPVRKKDIDRLKAWGIPFVQTDGEAISQQAATAGAAAAGRFATAASAQASPAGVAGLESADSAGKSGPPAAARPAVPGALEGIANPARILSLPDVQENKSVYRTYVDLIERLNALFSQIAAGYSVESRAIDAIAGRLLQAVRDTRDQFIGFILGGEVIGSELAKSSVNAAILATMIAIEMKIANHKVLQLATGALLHDVGMLKLPKELLEKKGSLTDAEIQRMKAHPLYAYKIVCKELLYAEDVGIVVLQHHERWDGEGYPRRTAGADIDLGARIVSVADAFEAMVTRKSYRNSMMGYQAMKNLLSDNSRRFDPDVLKAFIRTMGIYPIGSIVLLNNGALARVTEVQGEAPLRPVITILIDEFGHVFEQGEGETVNLLTEKSLFIARAIDPKEYTASA